MSITESTVAVGKPTAATLDDLMLAMDVVDTLRHRDRLVERELNEDVRDEQLIERLRALYKSQGIDVPDTILADGVKALKESRFAYTPPAPSFARTLATIWVKRGTYGKLAAAGLVTLAVFVGAYYFGVVRPRERAAQSAQVEITQTLPRQLAAAHGAVVAEAQSPAVRQRADAILARGRAALERGNVVDARAAIAELDQLAALLRREYVLRIAGRPSPSKPSTPCAMTRRGTALYKTHAWPRNAEASSSPSLECRCSKAGSRVGKDGTPCLQAVRRCSRLNRRSAASARTKAASMPR